MELVKSIWGKLKPKVEAKPAALEAAKDAALTPDDEDAQAALRVQLKKLLTEHQCLAEEVSRWLEKDKAAGINVSAIGERSVAIGSDVQGTMIVTADGNEVQS